jgi:probable rRNA maturation factor
MTEIINQQRKIKIEAETFQRFAETAIREIADGKIAAIAFVSDRKMCQLNREFRGKDSTTDVLSFPFEADEFDVDDNFLGDIVISLEQAKRQAMENNLTFDLEVKQLILHGILHLLGYDHETDQGQMNELELKWRENLGVG